MSTTRERGTWSANGTDLRKHTVAGQKLYWNPYRAGVGLGLTLLAAFLITGRGVGTSGAFTTAVSVGVHTLAPGHTTDNGVFSAYLDNGGRHPMADWFVFEVLGIFVGGFVSGLLARRRKVEVVMGPRASIGSRLALAFTGGVLMGYAAKLARGCTSGQALSGGALLNVGSWVFMLALFGAAFAGARLVRRQWT